MESRDERVRKKLIKVLWKHRATNILNIEARENMATDLLTAIKQEYEPDIFRYLGGEDDGYGGKTAPITWKEECEDREQYETWAMKEMKKACEKIKAHPKWEYGENAYPSPYERAIVAGCCQAVEQLKKELADALCGKVKAEPKCPEKTPQEER